MAKTLCDWSKKDIEHRMAELTELLRDPRFVCMKCARCANTPKVLCRPERQFLPPSHRMAPEKPESDDLELSAEAILAKARELLYEAGRK